MRVLVLLVTAVDQQHKALVNRREVLKESAVEDEPSPREVGEKGEDEKTKWDQEV